MNPHALMPCSNLVLLNYFETGPLTVHHSVRGRSHLIHIIHTSHKNSKAISLGPDTSFNWTNNILNIWTNSSSNLSNSMLQVAFQVLEFLTCLIKFKSHFLSMWILNWLYLTGNIRTLNVPFQLLGSRRALEVHAALIA